MAGQPPTRRRRSSAAMYDPARDIFTASIDTIDEPNEPTEQTSSPVDGREVSSPVVTSHPTSARDPHQLNGSLTSRASKDFEYAVESPESLKDVDVKSRFLSRKLPSEDGDHQDRLSSPRIPSQTSSPLISNKTPESTMAAPPNKKRRLSPVSQSSLQDRASIDREITSSKKRESGGLRDIRDGEEARRPLDSGDGPVYSKRRRPEKPQRGSRRVRSPVSAYSRRDTPQDRSHSPRRRSRSPRRRSPYYRERDSYRRSRSPRQRSPRPISRSPSRSPPRQRKKPGGAARISQDQKDAIKRRAIEREQAQQREALQVVTERGVHDVVRQHYNAVPERGREWRKTDSQIKGLRSFNNWVKSTIIQKFSPNEDFSSQDDWGHQDETSKESDKGLLVLDIGCGKGGDLGKWQQAPQQLELYVGLDPADISISQARDRFGQMRGGRGQRGPGGRPRRLFHGEFFVKDCFGEWIGELPIIQQVGIDANVGPGSNGMASRWGGGGGFDVVSMMFCMHYAFESEEKARGMLRNVAGSLKKGGRFLGVIPNSDILSAKVKEFHDDRERKEKEKEKSKDENEEGEVEDVSSEVPEWGNSIYRVRFPGKTPEDGVFRPPFGWKYSFFLQEAVEEVPEYVVPWEAFRAMTEDYNLELQYRRPFKEIWEEEKNDPTLGPLSERMGVRGRGAGPLLVSEDEMDAAGFYHAFCFYKV